MNWKNFLRKEKKVLSIVSILGVLILAASAFLLPQYLRSNEVGDTTDAATPVQPIRSAYPPESSILEKQIVPTLAMPEYLKPVIDPVFKTKVTRIGDQKAYQDFFKLSSAPPNVRHHYSRDQPWNVDGSLLLLSHPTKPAPILDGKTYQILRRANLPRWPLWSYVNPKKVYGITYNFQFSSCNVDTCDTTDKKYDLIRDFSKVTEDNPVAIDYLSVGEGEGNISNDDKMAVFQAKSGKNTFLITFDILQNKVISRYQIPNGKWPNNVTMSQSGKYVVVNWGDANSARHTGLELYDANLNFIRQLAPGYGHGDTAFNESTSKEYFVMMIYYTDNSTAGIKAYSLSANTNEDIDVLKMDNPGTPKFFPAGHISCRNVNRPGWCYISGTGKGQENRWIGYDEVFAIKLDGSQKVNRFAHMHRTTTNNEYLSLAMAVPNRDGTKVVWASDWQKGAGSPIYSYVAEQTEQSTAPTISPTPTKIPQTTPTISKTPTTTPTVTSTVKPTTSTTSSPTSTSTVKPTITSTPTPTVTLTPVATPKPTPTFIPTPTVLPTQTTAPDLIVDSFYISSASRPKLGDMITFTVKIKNTSAAIIAQGTKANIGIYLNNGVNPETVTTFATPRMGSGSTFEVRLSWIADRVGTLSVKAKVDALNTILERNETNNLFPTARSIIVTNGTSLGSTNLITCQDSVSNWLGIQSTVVKDSKVTLEGKAACEVRYAGNQGTYSVKNRQTVFLNPAFGTKYTYSVWVKAGKNTLDKKVRLALNQTGGKTCTDTLYSEEVSLTDQWQKVSMEITINQTDRTIFEAGIESVNTTSPAISGDSFYVNNAQISILKDQL